MAKHITRPIQILSFKISPYALALTVILLIGYGRFLWPSYSSFGDWAFPNPSRSLLFSDWLPLFNWFDLNSYTGLAFHVLIDPLMSFLHTFLHLPALWLMTLFYYWLPIVLMSSGMWRLVKEVTKNHQAAFWASLVFTVNAFIITLLIGGHLNGAVAYGTMPWIIWGLHTLSTHPSARRAAILGLWLALQGIYEPRYILITVIIALFWMFGLWLRHQLTTKVLLYAFLAGGYFVLLSFFWIYGAFFVKGTALASPEYMTEPWLRALSYANILHTSSLHHVWWPFQTLSAKPSLIYFLLPLVSFAALFSRRWLKFTVPLWLLALVGIFLAKGANPPAGAINIWIFLHLPGFSAFRDPSKFFSIIGFTYAILFGLGVVVINTGIQRLRWHRKKIILPLLLLLFFFFGYQPLWMQRVKGTFVKQPQLINRVNEWFTTQSDHNDWYRVFWWPTIYQYLTFDGQHIPVIATGNVLSKTIERLPGVYHWIGDQEGNPRFLSYFINAFGIRYVAVPGDTVNNDFYKHNFSFSQDQYSAKVDETALFDSKYEVLDENGKTTHLWHNPNALGQVFTSKEIIITDNNDSGAFNTLADSDPLTNSLVFYDPQTASQDGIGSVFNQAKHIILTINYDTSQLDKGFLMWPLNVPTSGSFRLLLPESGLNLSYTLDDQPLIGDGPQSIGDQQFLAYTVKNLAAGNHQLKAVLSSLEGESSLTTGFLDTNSDWTPCQISDVGPLGKLYEKSNNQYFSTPHATLTSAAEEIRCLQVKLPLSQGKRWILINHDVTTDHPQAELYLNLVGIKDYHLPLNGVKGNYQLITTTDRVFTQATAALILPDSNQTATLAVNNVWFYDLGQADMNQMILEPNPQPAEFTTDTPTIKDNSPVNKIVTIKHNPQGIVMTFSSEYHPGWQLTTADGKIINDHFSTLLKQNAWYIPAGTAGQLTLVFRPAEPIKKAAYLSLFGLIVVVLLVVRLPRKKL